MHRFIQTYSHTYVHIHIYTYIHIHIQTYTTYMCQRHLRGRLLWIHQQAYVANRRQHGTWNLELGICLQFGSLELGLGLKRTTTATDPVVESQSPHPPFYKSHKHRCLPKKPKAVLKPKPGFREISVSQCSGIVLLCLPVCRAYPDPKYGTSFGCRTCCISHMKPVINKSTTI